MSKAKCCLNTSGKIPTSSINFSNQGSCQFRQELEFRSIQILCSSRNYEIKSIDPSWSFKLFLSLYRQNIIYCSATETLRCICVNKIKVFLIIATSDKK